jgi:hypothetical protein
MANNIKYGAVKYSVIPAFTNIFSKIEADLLNSHCLFYSVNKYALLRCTHRVSFACYTQNK